MSPDPKPTTLAFDTIPADAAQSARPVGSPSPTGRARRNGQRSRSEGGRHGPNKDFEPEVRIPLHTLSDFSSNGKSSTNGPLTNINKSTLIIIPLSRDASTCSKYLLSITECRHFKNEGDQELLKSRMRSALQEKRARMQGPHPSHANWTDLAKTIRQQK